MFILKQNCFTVSYIAEFTVIGFVLRWPNTVFACAFADAIECVHKDCKNKHAVNRAIILFTQHSHYLCYFFSIIERSVLMALVFYHKYMLEKVKM